jgi:hypothetical protein
MKFSKYTFGIAAAYGIFVILPLFFSEQKLGIDYPPPINHAEYFYSFAGVALVWQILFIFVAWDPIRFKPIIIPCILEKLSLLPAFLLLFPLGRFPQLWIPMLLIDLGFAAAFFMAYRNLRTVS